MFLTQFFGTHINNSDNREEIGTPHHFERHTSK